MGKYVRENFPSHREPLFGLMVARVMSPVWLKVCGSNFRLTSLENAEVTGKPHNDVLKAIRKMEQAWVNVTQSKFGLRRKAGWFS